MESNEASRLVQLQQDRFAFNWRRSTGSQYTSYDENSQRCLEEFSEFTDFCRDNDLGEVRPNAAEVVYVNHVFPEKGERAVELLARLFVGLEWKHSDTWLPMPSTATINRVYEIPPARGRLYVEASLALAKDQTDYVAVSLTARINQLEGADIEASLSLAHTWIVNGFVSVTDMTIQRDRWGKRLLPT